jgi:hypothetical protein
MSTLVINVTFVIDGANALTSLADAIVASIGVRLVSCKT